MSTALEQVVAASLSVTSELMQLSEKKIRPSFTMAGIDRDEQLHVLGSWIIAAPTRHACDPWPHAGEGSKLFGR